MTSLDRAHAAMEAAPEDAVARLGFYERLADAELYLLLTREPEGEALDPRLFDISGGRFALAFDRPERLSQFVGGAAPYAALSGRVLAAMLAGHEIGLAVNPEVAPSSILVPAEAISWLSETLKDGPTEVDARPESLSPPGDLPERLISALDTKLATATGLARCAYLVGVTYDTGARSHMLAFVAAARGAEGALARATREALVFSGLEAGELDVTFLGGADPMLPRLDAAGLRFDLPVFDPALSPAAPGLDPERPPRLR